MGEDRQQTDGYFDEGDAAVTVADGEAPAPDERAPFERGVTLGRYLVLDKLGSGGMGVVLAAYDSKLDRRVALKLLRPHASRSPENHARLLREAQALAKLSHPAVVAVYDVGEIQDRVFIAMEYIDGPDLRRWTRDGAHSVAEIIAVFRGAARGLQAAHDAGIIHRDFKPDNVLIGSDGRPRVTDFGLAVDEKTLIPTGAPEPPSANPRLTETGMVMGTPAYMPIEQHRGLPSDHRSDQFAFCVSFFEALYGVRPYAGANGNEYCAAIERGELPQPPSSVSVPRRVHRAIVRGLSANADDRFPSMRALLRAITPPTRNRRTWLIGGVGGVALGATAVALVDPPERPCSSFDARMAEVYGDAHARSLHEAFKATEVPYSTASFEAADRVLRDYGQQWIASASEACMASERGEQSDSMLDLRMRCLDRGLQSVVAIRDALTDADARVVEQAGALVGQLPSLEPCSDPGMLTQYGFALENEEQRRDLDELQPVLERAGVLAWQDRFSDAAVAIGPLRERLEASTHPRIRALHAELLGRLPPPQEAEEHFREAIRIALEHNIDDVAANASLQIAYIHKDQGKFDLATQGFRRGVALGRAAGARKRVVDGLMGLAKLAEARLDYDEAAAYTRQALETLGPDGPAANRASILVMLSSQLLLRDGSDAGLEELERAHALLVRQVGEDHPSVEEYLQEVLKRANARGDAKLALETGERLVRLIRRNRGPGSSREAVTLANMSTAQMTLGGYEDALSSLGQADEILRKVYGGDYPDRAGLLNNRSEVMVHLGRLDDARETLTLARSLFDARLGPGNEGSAVTLLNLCEVERRAGRLEEARAYGKASLAAFTKARGPIHVRVARAHAAIAEVDLAAGDGASARAHLDASREIGTPKPAEAQLWTILHAEATLLDASASADDRQRVRKAVALEREGLLQGTPYSEGIAQALTRVERLTGED